MHDRMPQDVDNAFIPGAPTAKFRTVFTDEHAHAPEAIGQGVAPEFMGYELVESMQQRLAHLEEDLFSMKMDSSSRGANYCDRGYTSQAEHLEVLVTERVASVTERADALMLLITEERMQRQLDVAAALQRITSVEMRAEAAEATAQQAAALNRGGQNHTITSDVQHRLVALAAAEASKQLRAESEGWRMQHERSTKALEMKLGAIVAEFHSTSEYHRARREHRQHDESGDKLASSSVSTVMLESTHAGTEAATTSRDVDALHGGFDALQAQLRDVRLLMDEMDTRSRGFADGTFRRCDSLWAECQRRFAEIERSINNERLERQDKDQLLANKLEAGLQRLIYKLENGTFRADDASELACGKNAMPLGASASYVSARLGTPPAPLPSITPATGAPAKLTGEVAPFGLVPPHATMPWLFTRNSLVPNSSSAAQDKSGSPPRVLRRTPPREERSALRWRWQLPPQTQSPVITPWRFSTGPVASAQLAPPAVAGQPSTHAPGHAPRSPSPSMSPAAVARPPASPAVAHTGRPLRSPAPGAVVIASPVAITRQLSASPRSSRGRLQVSPGPLPGRFLQLKPNSKPAAAHSPIPGVAASASANRGRSPSPCRTAVHSAPTQPTLVATSSPHASVAGSPSCSPCPSPSTSPATPMPFLGIPAGVPGKKLESRAPVPSSLMVPMASPTMSKPAIVCPTAQSLNFEERAAAALPVEPAASLAASMPVGASVAQGMQVEEREQWKMHLRVLHMANQSLVEQINVRDKLLQQKASSSPTNSPLVAMRPVLLEPTAGRSMDEAFSPPLVPRAMPSS